MILWKMHCKCVPRSNGNTHKIDTDIKLFYTSTATILIKKIYQPWKCDVLIDNDNQTRPPLMD